MQIVPLVEEARLSGEFRTPLAEVKIEGVGLPSDVLRDVRSVSYTDSVSALDTFELVVNNWDDSTRSFKYVGAETAADLDPDNNPGSLQNPLTRVFDPCGRSIEVRLGYVGRLRTMLTGTVTTLEPNFPRSGAPTLTVRGLNLLHQLRRKPYSWSWENKTDSEIASDLANLRDPQTGAARFPLPIEVSPTASRREPRLPYVAQDNLTDIDFLWMRARERGYVVVLEEADEDAGTERRIYFGPSRDGQSAALRDVAFVLHWGRTILEMKPTFSTSNQVRSVTVHGWNRVTKEPIEETVTLDDEELNRNEDLHHSLQVCDPREEVVRNLPVFTKEQARRRAIDLLRERSNTVIQATVLTIGVPDLRAGQVVRIEGIGARFSGDYFITGTEHTLNENGYLTQLTVRREDRGASS